MPRTFAERLRIALEESVHAGKNQVQLAKLWGVSKQMAGDYLNGKKEPRPARLVRIAETVDASPDWLISGRGERRYAPWRMTPTIVGELKKIEDGVNRAAADLGVVLGELARERIVAEIYNLQVSGKEVKNTDLAVFVRLLT